MGREFIEQKRPHGQRLHGTHREGFRRYLPRAANGFTFRGGRVRIRGRRRLQEPVFGSVFQKPPVPLLDHGDG